MKQITPLFVLFLALTSFGQKNDTLTVYFSINSSDISQKRTESLKALGAQINNKQLVLDHLEVYCDTTGTVSYNKNLASKRLSSTLKKLAIDTPNDNINALLYGEEFPSGQLQTHSNDQLRRVDIIYHPTLKSTPDLPLPPPPIANQLTDNFVSFLNDSTQTETIIQLSILFYPGSNAYLPESASELHDLFDFLHYNPTIKAHIRGHICCSDDSDGISYKRALAVHQYLVKRSISPHRLSAKGYGRTIPFAYPEITEEDKKKNRRVDVIFTKEK
ncbi:MAG: OmpA family protein [Crocinitomicaceae bacterium]|nr:OmpA family protein [Crocinitomicaceae bacterium]